MNKEFEFSIATTWDGEPLNHSPVEFKVSAVDETSVKVDVRGPLFNDPGPPPAPSGSPCPELWEFEVAEIFFLGADDKYLEVELSPHGQHLVLLLNGMRNMIKDKLALSYSATKDNVQKKWKGSATIPLDYFPPGVVKLNAYAIHGTGRDRCYEALYPATKEFDRPDFIVMYANETETKEKEKLPKMKKLTTTHRLQFFKDFNFSALFPASWKQPESTYWTTA